MAFDPKSAYAAKLRDPRWQKKRLEILNRDEFTCQMCFDTESTLVVHHRFYSNNREPWNYPDDCLVTLCQPCHEIEHDAKDAEKLLIQSIKRSGIFASDLDRISKGFMAFRLIYASEVSASFLEWFLSNPSELKWSFDRFSEPKKKRKVK